MASNLCLTSSQSSRVAPSARPTAEFHPSIWGDNFVTYAHDDTVLSKWREEAEALKREVQRMLTGGDYVLSKTQCTAKLCMIDSIQRLGVAYHFEEEIDIELHQIFDFYHHDKIDHSGADDEDDLYAVALQFRLLREYGYRVTCDIFSKFVDKNNKFKESVGEDPRGTLSLYEAAHLRVHGEAILDEALSFTTTRLQLMLPHLSPSFADNVLHALNRPIRRCLPRLDSIYYFSVYEEHYKDVQNQMLLRFAKLDFNILQKMHQKELSLLSKWWKDLDFVRKLPFARDRLVECYFWILGVYFEPKYAQARRFLTQMIAMTSTVDDIYDAYGTKEELELFTEAVNRWDKGAINDLPEYMKIYYRALLDVYRRMEEEMISQGKPLYGIECSKEAMRSVIRSYHEETKWAESAEFPTYEDYLKVALNSSGYPMLAVSSLVGMDINKEAFDWLLSEPKINKASALMSRLMDDIVSHKFEQKRGHSPSAVECFMRQHKILEDEACKNLKMDAECAWKDVNEAFLRPTPVSEPVLMRLLNLCRVMDVLYKDSDGYTHVNATIKGQIVSILSTAVQL